MARSRVSERDYEEEDNQSTAEERQYNGISVNLKTLTVSELKGYVTEKIQKYRDGVEVSEELYYIFCDDFDKQTKETFQKASTENVRALRDVLLIKGIYILKNNKPITTYLVKLLKTEVLGLWPEDVEQPIVLLAYQIAQGAQKMKENVKNATAVNKELLRVAELQKQHIKAITP